MVLLHAWSLIFDFLCYIQDILQLYQYEPNPFRVYLCPKRLEILPQLFRLALESNKGLIEKLQGIYESRCLSPNKMPSTKIPMLKPGW